MDDESLRTFEMAKESLWACNDLAPHEVIVDFDDTLFAWAYDVSVVGGNLEVKALHIGDSVAIFDMR